MEFRSAPVEVRGRRISGVAVPWGARARVEVRGEIVEETFVHDAFRNLRPVPLVREHRGPVVGEVVPSTTDRGLEVQGTYTGDLGGRDSFSIEFQAVGETRSDGLRIVHAAELHRLAAVVRPAYDAAVIEARRRLGPVLRGFVPVGKVLDCRCPSGQCDKVRFEVEAFDGLEEALVTTGTMDQVVGSAVLTPGRAGLGIAVDLLDVVAARDLTSLLSGGVAVYLRPLLDLEKSDTLEGRNQGGTLSVRKAVFSTVLAKPVAGGSGGLSPATLADGAANRGGLVRVTPPTPPHSIVTPFRRPVQWL